MIPSGMLYRVRAAAESAAAGARVGVCCGATVWAARHGVAFGPLGFAMGQLAYAVVLLGVYLWKMGRFSIVPRRVGEKS